MTKTTLLLTGTMLLALGACNGDDKGTLDADGDGFTVDDDCDDGDPSVNPGASEVCDDGIDNNCDGYDDTCIVDADGDGFAAEDDCDDGDPSINPDAEEDCEDGHDNDCDGVATVCLDPSMVYEEDLIGNGGVYSTAVFADQIVFGHHPGDGEALFFEYVPGTVEPADAITATPGDEGSFGVGFAHVGEHLCIHADYFGGSSGKSYCFSEDVVRTEIGTLSTTDADFTIAGEVTNGYATAQAMTDVDGDGLEDLVAYSSRQMHVVLGDGTDFTGDLSVPSGADISLGTCDSTSSIWCGYGRAVLTEDPGAILIAGDPVDDQSAWFDLPLVGTTPAADATYSIDRYQADNSAPMPTLSGFAVGNSAASELTLIDASGDTSIVDGPNNGAFGYWSTTGEDQAGHPLLIVSAPDKHDTVGNGDGVIYVFDLDLTPAPTGFGQAAYILRPPTAQAACGWRTDIGQITDDDGTRTVISSACSAFGGAVYELDFTDPPPPPLPPQAIVQVGPRRFEIKQQAVDLYTSRTSWVRSLAQTERVPGGWRLHAVEPGSPTDRLGLQNGDVVLSVNDYPLNTPAQVQAAAMGLMDASALRVDVRRGGNVQRVRYEIVP